jgi:hypothetical protein
VPAACGACSEKVKSCWYGFDASSGSGSSSAEVQPKMEALERVIPFGGSDFCAGVGDGKGPEAKQENHLG